MGSLQEDLALTIDLTIEDLDQDDGTLQLSAQSLNTALLPDGHPYIQLSGSGSTRAVLVAPKADQHGNVELKLTVTDEAGVSDVHIVNLTVSAINDAPAFEVRASIDPDDVID